MTDKTNNKEALIQPHGGYRKLLSFQSSSLVYDLTVEFCKIHMTYKTNMSHRTVDQMIQAARSGRQNIAEGSQISSTSKKTELKLVSVARASLEELLLDYEDFLRQKNIKVWTKDSVQAKAVRNLAYKTDRTNGTYKTYMLDASTAANTLICLIHQTNYLLDRQINSLEKSFLEEGGFTERLYRIRREKREF